VLRCYVTTTTATVATVVVNRVACCLFVYVYRRPTTIDYRTACCTQLFLYPFVFSALSELPRE
jgi:hypothetical protein